MIRIKIGANGNVGNRMFQYAYCKQLQKAVPGSLIEGYNIPEFKLLPQPTEPLPPRTLRIPSGHEHSISTIAYKLREGVYDALLFDGYVQRLEYYPSKDEFDSLFIADTPAVVAGKDELLINIRGKEVLKNTHKDYGPAPVSYFRQLADETGLTPVVMGEIDDDPYSEALRKAFDGCRFIGQQSPLEDFQTVRHAKNIAISVSSFSWLAAWLSVSAENIYMPVSGFLHPAQRPDVDLIPLNDKRYHFYEFPVEKWTATPEQLNHAINGTARFQKYTKEQLREIMK